MHNTCWVCKSPANWMTVSLILFGMLHLQAIFAQATDTSDQPEFQRKPEEAGYSLTTDEKAAFEQYLKFGRIEQACKNGSFFHTVTKSCEGCEKYCQNGKERKNCAMQCQVYYLHIENERLQKEAIEKGEQIAAMKTMMEQRIINLWIAIAFIVFLSIFSPVPLATLGKRWMERRIRNLQRSVMEPIAELQQKLRRQDTNDTRPLQEQIARSNGAVRFHAEVEGNDVVNDDDTMMELVQVEERG